MAGSIEQQRSSRGATRRKSLVLFAMLSVLSCGESSTAPGPPPAPPPPPAPRPTRSLDQEALVALYNATAERIGNGGTRG